MSGILQASQDFRDINPSAATRLPFWDDEIVVSRKLRRLDQPDVFEIRAMRRENLVVRREKDRRATARPEQEQLAGIGMREDLGDARWLGRSRSEEHTSELQSQSNIVCRLLLEKKKKSLQP